MNDLKGKVAIITGSGDGIGAGIALEFVRQGALVTVHDRNVKSLDSIVERCQALNQDKTKPLSILGDICNSDIRQQLIDETVRHYGKLDVVVSNAGYAILDMVTHGCDLTAFDQMLDVHTRAPYHLLKLSTEHLIETKGNFICICSVAGARSIFLDYTGYGTAKAATEHMTKYAALELGPRGVRVNAINPGFINTNIMTNSASINPQNAHLIAQDFSHMPERIPLQRVGEVKDVAQLAAFLASDKASYITGSTCVVDGGIINVGAAVDFSNIM